MEYKFFSHNAIIGILMLALCLFFADKAVAQRDPGLISSRNYVGIEVGVNDSWLGGASSDFFWTYAYPYTDPLATEVVGALPLTQLGSGVGFHVAGTLDLSFTDFLGLQTKVFYRSNHVGNTEQRVISCADVNGGAAAPATLEDNYSMTLNYIGLSAAIRLQFIPKSFYGIVGLEYSALVSNHFSGYEKIISSTNGCQYLYLPNGTTQTGSTEIIIPEAPASSNFLNSSQLAIKLGIGTFIGLGGSNHWVLTPEFNIGIPLSTFFQSQIETAYQNGYPTNNPNNPNYAPVTTPKLWYASVSIALKFPFGAISKAEMESSEPVAAPVKEEKTPSGYANLKGKVTDAKTGNPVRANLTVTDLNSNEVVTQTHSDNDGSYDVRVKAPGRYSVTADADGYLFGSSYFEVDDEGRILRGNHDIKLDAATGRTRLLVFFDFNKAELQRSSYPELDRVVHLMQANPKMQVEIAGYTDSKGTDSYNLDLSKRRAEAVKEYLLKKGISGGRIVTKGYGKDNPISTNETEDGRAENRRVEFVVLSR